MNKRISITSRILSGYFNYMVAYRGMYHHYEASVVNVYQYSNWYSALVF